MSINRILQQRIVTITNVFVMSNIINGKSFPSICLLIRKYAKYRQCVIFFYHIDLRQVSGFLPGTSVFSTNKTEILLKVAVNSVTLAQMISHQILLTQLGVYHFIKVLKQKKTHVIISHAYNFCKNEIQNDIKQYIKNKNHFSILQSWTGLHKPQLNLSVNQNLIDT